MDENNTAKLASKLHQNWAARNNNNVVFKVFIKYRESQKILSRKIAKSFDQMAIQRCKGEEWGLTHV